MSVYVDDAKIPRKMGYGRVWKFCHMIADTRSELDEMAEEIELDTKWKQKAGTIQEHYDVTLNYRLRAIEKGAKSVSPRELAIKMFDRNLKSYLEG